MSDMAEKFSAPSHSSGPARAKLKHLMARWGRVTTSSEKQPTHVLIVSMDPEGELWELESGDSYVLRDDQDNARELLRRTGVEVGVPVPEVAR